MSYYLDRFHSAVLTLAGDGNVKQRLQQAFEENLEPIPEDELPGDLKQDFLDLKKRMTAVQPVMGEGCVTATVRKMSAREASLCASSVVSLYRQLVAEARESVAAIAPPDVTTSPFLVKTAAS